MDKMKRLEARLTDTELQQLEERMKSSGIQNKSAYLRKMAINGYIIQVDLSEVKEMIRLLRINSNNLNQYARVANECGSIYEEDIRNLQAQQKELWTEMRKILEMLSKLQV
jgi:predicted RNase H-like nuclease (RuvC/YqgF family)